MNQLRKLEFDPKNKKPCIMLCTIGLSKMAGGLERNLIHLSSYLAVRKRRPHRDL